jgi:hypothetical protein
VLDVNVQLNLATVDVSLVDEYFEKEVGMEGE